VKPSKVHVCRGLGNHNEFVVCFFLERYEKVQVYSCDPFSSLPSESNSQISQNQSASRFQFKKVKTWADVTSIQSVDFLKNDERNSLSAQALKLSSEARFGTKNAAQTTSDWAEFFKSRLHLMKKDMVLFDKKR